MNEEERKDHEEKANYYLHEMRIDDLDSLEEEFNKMWCNRI